MIRIGVTGSIGMGKSTVARAFGRHGAAIHDADAAVHALYRGAAVEPVGRAFPEAIEAGMVDRTRLSALLAAAPDRLAELERIVHPLVQEAGRLAIRAAAAADRKMIVLDIPLLLETGGERRVDVVVVASAPAPIQRQRVLTRPGMSEARLDAILARQMPDADKRRRAHFIVETGGAVAAAERQVADIVRALAALAAGLPDRG